MYFIRPLYLRWKSWSGNTELFPVDHAGLEKEVRSLSRGARQEGGEGSPRCASACRICLRGTCPRWEGKSIWHTWRVRSQLLIPGPVGSLPVILSSVLKHRAPRQASSSVISAFYSLWGLYYQVYALSVSFLIWIIYRECCRLYVGISQIS